MRDFSWIARSRKAQVALGAVVSIIGVRVLRRFGLSDQDAHDVISALLVLGAAWVAGIAIEDHGANSNNEIRMTNVNDAVSRQSGGPDGAAAGGAAAP